MKFKLASGATNDTTTVIATRIQDRSATSHDKRNTSDYLFAKAHCARGNRYVDGTTAAADSDITRRGEVGMWGLGRRRRARAIIVVIIDARCVCPAPRRHAASAATAARAEHRGWNGVTTSSAIAAASEPPPGGFACSLRTHAPVRGAFSRRGSYVVCDAGGGGG